MYGLILEIFLGESKMMIIDKVDAGHTKLLGLKGLKGGKNV